jgi:hypothetical protein
MKVLRRCRSSPLPCYIGTVARLGGHLNSECALSSLRPAGWWTRVKLHLIVHRVQDMNMHVCPADLTTAVDALKAEITLRLEPEYALNRILYFYNNLILVARIDPHLSISCQSHCGGCWLPFSSFYIVITDFFSGYYFLLWCWRWRAIASCRLSLLCLSVRDLESPMLLSVFFFRRTAIFHHRIFLFSHLGLE